VATLCTLSGLEASSAEWTRIDAMVEAFASKGYRTIAVGHQLAGEEAKHMLGGEHGHESQALLGPAGGARGRFHLVGLIALYDPPRADSKAIVDRLLSLGIQTKMLTGDALGVACETGRALAMGTKFINLEHEKERIKAEWAANPPETRIDVGKDAKTKSAETVADELEARVMHHLLSQHDPLSISGFAQIFPSDKHFIVKHTQAKGLVCGMTGDGVNDAPALKQAGQILRDNATRLMT
jgi:H+-transporting ATPase